MRTSKDLRIKLFADGADLGEIKKLKADPLIAGFTTNPTLMRKAGVKDYEAFAKDMLQIVDGLPVSFEVFSDDFSDMERQARIIASWGNNVYVKIPVYNTKKESSLNLIRTLSLDGIKVNVTALMLPYQVAGAIDALRAGTPAYVSVFAGRVADTGVDPEPLMLSISKMLFFHSHIELIWASPREVLNVYQAERTGSDIITATPDILKKLSLMDKDLTQYSLETVQMFYEDAKIAGYTL